MVAEEQLLRPRAVILAHTGGKPKGNPRKPSDPKARAALLERRIVTLESEVVGLTNRLATLEKMLGLHGGSDGD